MPLSSQLRKQISQQLARVHHSPHTLLIMGRFRHSNSSSVWELTWLRWASAARSSRTTIQGRIRTQNSPPDFDRDYPSRQMPVIAGETRSDGRKIT